MTTLLTFGGAAAATKISLLLGIFMLIKYLDIQYPDNVLLIFETTSSEFLPAIFIDQSKEFFQEDYETYKNEFTIN